MNTSSTLAAIASCLIVACNAGSDEKQIGTNTAPVERTAPATPPPTPPPATPTPPVPNVTLKPDADGVVHLTGSDQMRYNANRIEAKAGDKLKVELKNMGTLAKAAMGHDFILLKPGADVAAFATKAAVSQATDYIPADTSDILAHTKLLGPGETDTIELPVLAAGTYTFLCSFPGHYVFMTGQLVLQ